MYHLWKLCVTFYVVKVANLLNKKWHVTLRVVDGSNESLYYSDEELDLNLRTGTPWPKKISKIGCALALLLLIPFFEVPIPNLSLQGQRLAIIPLDSLVATLPNSILFPANFWAPKPNSWNFKSVFYAMKYQLLPLDVLAVSQLQPNYTLP